MFKYPQSQPTNDANAAFSMRFDDGLGCVSIFVFTLSDAEKRLQAPSEVEGQIPNQTNTKRQASNQIETIRKQRHKLARPTSQTEQANKQTNKR